jgi:Lysyl oxidase/Dockerin type I domain
MTILAIRRVQLFVTVICPLLVPLAELRSAPLLPDLIAWADKSRGYVYDGFVDPTFVPGKTVYRFNGALPNIGAGALEIRAETHPDHSQDVYQRIYDSAGGDPTETLIGTFADAAPIAPRHLWLPGIAQYKLREVAPDGGVGELLSMNDKTSMAVVDSVAYEPPPPGTPSTRKYNDVSAEILGISIGYGDLYDFSFAGQWADATGLASGTYWLEVTVNPYGDTPEGRIIESDYSNNTTRILVDLLPGDYNDDGIVDAADYTVWRDTLGDAVAILTTGADGDGDGQVTAADYDVWKQHFGATLAPERGAAGIAVPEPVVAASVCLGVAGGGLFSNRGRSRRVGVELRA